MTKTGLEEFFKNHTYDQAQILTLDPAERVKLHEFCATRTS